MTPAEASKILAKAAAFDNRTPSKVAPAAWAEALDGIDLDDALTAVTRHYATTDDYLKPIHILRIAEDLNRARARARREAAEHRAIEADRAARQHTDDRSAQVEHLIAQVRLELPDTGKEAIRPREVAWERERRLRNRPPAAPNPLYDPTALERLRDMDPGA